MIDTALTRKGSTFERWLNRVAKRMLDAGWTPNDATRLALLCGIVSGACFYGGSALLGFAGLLASALLDAVDGRMARQGSGPTPWGGVMDLIFDRIVEASVLLGIILPRPDLHPIGLVVVATWYVNITVFLAVGAASEKYSEKVIFYPPGLLERGESLLFAFVVVAFPTWAWMACSLYAALEVITAWQRFQHGREALAATVVRTANEIPRDENPLS